MDRDASADCLSQTLRLARHLQRVAATLLIVALLGFGVLVWLSVTQEQATAALTQSLLDILNGSPTR